MSKFQTLVIGAAALLVLPFAMVAIGLSTNTATLIVTLVIAALGLNMLVGFTGLTSFGHRITSYNVCYTKLLRFPGLVDQKDTASATVKGHPQNADDGIQDRSQ